MRTLQNGGNISQLVQNGVTVTEEPGFQNTGNFLIASVQLLDSAASSIGKNLPVLLNTAGGKVPLAGPLISTISVLNNGQQILKDVSIGSVQKAQVIGAVADVAGAIGAIALGLAAVAAGTAGAVAVVVTLGAALTVASIGLTIASVAVGEDRLQVPVILTDAIAGLSRLRDTITTAFDQAYTDVGEAVRSFKSNRDQILLTPS